MLTVTYVNTFEWAMLQTFSFLRRLLQITFSDQTMRWSRYTSQRNAIHMTLLNGKTIIHHEIELVPPSPSSRALKSIASIGCVLGSLLALAGKWDTFETVINKVQSVSSATWRFSKN